MAQVYSDPSRESDAHALPDVEVFFNFDDIRSGWHDFLEDVDGERLPEGWYYWSCFPGCMPDSEPSGPFATEADATADAQGLFTYI